MERQRSILSFFQKPTPENRSSGGPSPYPHALHRRLPMKQEPHSLPDDPSKELFPEVRGTDTPPAKLGRSIFPAGAPAAGDAAHRAAQPFSSIMHKFARGDGSESFDERNQNGNCSFSPQLRSDKLDKIQVHVKNEMTSHDCSNTYFSTFDDNYNGEIPPHIVLNSDILGPETPANRPLVPRLKRIQEEPRDVDDVSSLRLGPSKRPKSIQMIKEENQGELHESATSKFEWLNPSSIRDGSGRRPNDPLYDKRTLYIPPDVLKKLSASQKQYWSVKCQYMDVILFFKVGKFYELYELDAEIGQKELDWKMTISGVGKCRQVGISEGGIDDAVQKLVALGYKVGRMEQLETSDQAKARGPTSIIQRKLVHVSTPSTISDGSMGPDAVHLLALREETRELEKGSTLYGFAFVDYAALKFWIGSICDDDSYAALGALLMQVSPREVVYDSSGLSKETQKALIKYASAGSIKMQLTPVIPSVDLLDASEIRKLIHSKGYFKGSMDTWASIVDCTMHHDLVICALGGLVDHLCRIKLDDALCNGELLPYLIYNSCLKMDGQTLVNLEIFGNNYDGGLSGTLYKHRNHCITPSGKRLLRRWICRPLKNVDEINDRLDIVEGLIKHSWVMSIVAEYLHRLPDLERLLGRVKATVGSSSAIFLPLVGVRVLKQRKEDHGILALLKVVNLPMLSGLAGLINQFEVAMDDDFPNCQDHNVKDADAETLSVLVELFAGKPAEWSHVIQAVNCIDVLQSFAATANSSCGSMSRPVLLPINSNSMISGQDNRGPIIQLKGLWHPYAGKMAMV